MTIVRCKRCNRVLTNPQSIKDGYGKKCLRMVKLAEVVKKEKSDFQEELDFLRMEIKFLKRQFATLKTSGVKAPGIERIDRNEKRPEQTPMVVNMVLIIKELKVEIKNGVNLEPVPEGLRNHEDIYLVH